MDKFREEFEYIIVDLPPVTSVIDPVAISKFIDGMLVVVRHGFSRKQSLHSAMNQLKYADVHVLGFVYNGYFSGSGYYKRHYRYYRYKGYYGNHYYYESNSKDAGKEKNASAKK